MTNKHTPGPWKLNPEKESFYIRIETAQGECLGTALPVSMNTSWEQVEVNAQLIAAAPLLLKALETIRRQSSKIVNAGRKEDIHYFNIAEQVIKKATS